MPYVIQFNRSDTLAATLNSGATSTTLTTGNFGSPSGTQIYVVDYDVPAKAEIISATVSLTSVTSITRGLTGGAAGTTDHAVGAKIASIFVPQHYGDLGKIAASDEWTSWTPTVTITGGGSITVGPTNVRSRYIQLGKTIIWSAKFTLTTSGTVASINFTAPVNRTNTETNVSIGGGSVDYGTNVQAKTQWFGGSTSVMYTTRYDAGNFTAGATTVTLSGIYEIS